MTVNVPWSTLRPNPRDQRERAAANAGVPGSGDSLPFTKDGEQQIAWDVTDFGKRMAFGGIVSTARTVAVWVEPVVLLCKRLPCCFRHTVTLTVKTVRRGSRCSCAGDVAIDLIQDIHLVWYRNVDIESSSPLSEPARVVLRIHPSTHQAFDLWRLRTRHYCGCCCCCFCVACRLD